MSQNAANFPTSVWDGTAPNRDSRNVDAGPDYEDWDQIVAEVLATQGYLISPLTSGAGSAAGTGVSASSSRGSVNVTTITIAALSVTITDATTAGAHGTQKIFDFPAGNILVMGAVGTLSFTAGAGGIADTAAVVASIGSAAVVTDNATLLTTEADIVPSTSATLSGGVNAAIDMASTAQLVKDGTSSAASANLNIAVPDAGSTANDTITVSGTVTITWLNLGDN